MLDRPARYGKKKFFDDGLLKQLTAAGLAAYIGTLGYMVQNLVPNPTVDIVEWIEGSIVLPTAVSTRSGPIVLTPVQRHIARLLQRDGVRRVTFLKTPRMGSTLFNAALLLYFAVHEGVDVLYYERTDPDAQAFHDKKLFPIMCESSKIMEQMRPDTRSGVQDKWSDRILRNGAALQLRSGFGDGSARAIKGRFIAIDEASSKEFQPSGKDGEGNKVEKIWRRGQEFADVIMYIGGTPTNEDICIVTQEFLKGDRNVIEMPFACCNTWQEFVDDVQRVGSRDDRRGAGIRYLMDDTGKVTDVWYECGNPNCRSCVEEIDKTMMMEASRLRPTAEPVDERYASIVAWLAYSSDPQATWTDIAREHAMSVADPAYRQTYENLTRARAWKFEPPRAIPLGEVEKRAEEYGADCPAWVTRVFYGIDNQQGGNGLLPRSEIVFYGVGPNQRRAVIKRVIISHHDVVDPETGEVERVPCEPFTGPSMRAIWDEIDKPIMTADGRVLHATRGACDVGWRMHEALTFCHHPESRKRKIMPVRGRKETGVRGTILPPQMSTHAKSKMTFFMIGGQTVKDYLYENFGKPGGQAHSWAFPSDKSLLGEDFYEQLLSERLWETRPGSKQFLWDKVKQGDSNEVLDCIVYAFAAEQIECKRNRVVKQELALTLQATVAPENVGYHVVAADPETAPAQDRPMPQSEDAPAEGGENVAPAAPAPSISINARVVKRAPRQEPARPPAATPAPRSRRRAKLLDW